MNVVPGQHKPLREKSSAGFARAMFRDTEPAFEGARPQTLTPAKRLACLDLTARSVGWTTLVAGTLLAIVVFPYKSTLPSVWILIQRHGKRGSAIKSIRSRNAGPDDARPKVLRMPQVAQPSSIQREAGKGGAAFRRHGAVWCHEAPVVHR